MQSKLLRVAREGKDLGVIVTSEAKYVKQCASTSKNVNMMLVCSHARMLVCSQGTFTRNNLVIIQLAGEISPRIYGVFLAPNYKNIELLESSPSLKILNSFH